MSNKAIELAALAAGYECRLEPTGMYSVFMFDRTWVYFEPDANDGDALRLAVKLNMMVAVSSESTSARMPCDCRCNAVAYGVQGTNAEERTRTAILLCAAKHGSAMQRAAGGPYCAECDNHLCGGTGIFQGSECIGIPF